VPTLIIHGTADKTVPIDAAGRAAAAGIAGSTLIEYDGAPHGLFASHKERFTRDLVEFLIK
jgi:pimeloyl-ACP methyl ester carboxylesterase